MKGVCEPKDSAQVRVRRSVLVCVGLSIMCVYVHELRGTCVCMCECVCAESAGSYVSSKKAVSKSDHQAAGALLSAAACMCLYMCSLT